MKSQPDRIVFATERALQIPVLRQLLGYCGLDANLSVCRPDTLIRHLPPTESCLVILDGEALHPWEAIATTRSSGSNVRFVMLAYPVTPQLIHAALSAQLDGVLSTSLPVEDLCRAMLLVWQGEAQYLFGIEPSDKRNRRAGVSQSIRMDNHFYWEAPAC